MQVEEVNSVITLMEGLYVNISKRQLGIEWTGKSTECTDTFVMPKKNK